MDPTSSISTLSTHLVDRPPKQRAPKVNGVCIQESHRAIANTDAILNGWLALAMLSILQTPRQAQRLSTERTGEITHLLVWFNYILYKLVL